MSWVEFRILIIKTINMTTGKILVALDFDETLVDGNTSSKVKTLLKGRELPKEIEALSQVRDGFNAYMRELFRYLGRECCVTRADYVHMLSGMMLVGGMHDLLLQMHEIDNLEIVIVSDANAFFVQTVLRQNQMSGLVSRLFTNPAEFDRDGCLQIRQFHNQTACSRCPSNMCKGTILVNYVAKRLTEGIQFYRTFYVGDGFNDVCPALRLGPNDCVFARAGRKLLRSLEKMPAKNVKASVVAWETGTDIKNVLLSSQ